MGDEPTHVRQVRWMGVGIGVIVAVLGLLVCLGAWSFGTEAAEKGGAGQWLGTAASLGVGVLLIRYGLSLIRRARTDDAVATLTIDEGKRYRAFWWSRRSPRR
jgi:hypothetical protein